jgi:hypothetical protein
LHAYGSSIRTVAETTWEGKIEVLYKTLDERKVKHTHKYLVLHCHGQSKKLNHLHPIARIVHKLKYFFTIKGIVRVSGVA